MNVSSQRDGTAPPSQGQSERARARILRTVRERLPTRRAHEIASLAHEEYEGRHVLSIVARDEYDDLEPVTYYDQLVFARHRPRTGADGKPLCSAIIALLLDDPTVFSDMHPLVCRPDSGEEPFQSREGTSPGRSSKPRRARTANLCRPCGQDFASVVAFDRHRTGAHEYLFAEGLQMDPPHEDGRRCLAPEEMLEAGMELDPKARWKLSPTEAQKAFYRLNSPVLSAS